MATKKADAPRPYTKEERVQLKVDAILKTAREQIEKWIHDRHRPAAGGTFDIPLFDAHYYEASKGAMDILIKEYRDAGWTFGSRAFLCA